MAKARRVKSEDPPAEGAPEWMLTYSDLVTLLLTFFIMLFSMSVVDKQKYEEVANSLRSAFTHFSNGDMLNTNAGVSPLKLYEQNNPTNEGNAEFSEDSAVDLEKENAREKKLESAKEQIQAAIIELDIKDYVSLNEHEDLLVLRFDSYILFDLGSADIRTDGKNVLQKLGTMLNLLDNDIVIQGHTDNLPINTDYFPTNWELSTKRATNVVLFLIDKCGLNGQRLTASGNGEFKPLAPNTSDANRQKNRRIDIVIKK